MVYAATKVPRPGNGPTRLGRMLMRPRRDTSDAALLNRIACRGEAVSIPASGAAAGFASPRQRQQGLCGHPADVFHPATQFAANDEEA